MVIIRKADWDENAVRRKERSDWRWGTTGDRVAILQSKTNLSPPLLRHLHFISVDALRLLSVGQESRGIPVNSHNEAIHKTLELTLRQCGQRDSGALPIWATAFDDGSALTL